jgi:hypothetical protein
MTGKMIYIPKYILSIYEKGKTSRDRQRTGEIVSLSLQNISIRTDEGIRLPRFRTCVSSGILWAEHRWANHDGLHTGSETLHQEIVIPLLDNSLTVGERLVMQLSAAKTISIHSHPWGDFATTTNC